MRKRFRIVGVLKVKPARHLGRNNPIMGVVSGSNPAKAPVIMTIMTIGEHVENLKLEFAKLSKSRREKVVREAKVFIYRNPGSADHSNYWRGLSARQVIEANFAADNSDR